MAKILVFVPNAVTSDQRVLRQSASLARAGHDVEIVGIATKEKPDLKATAGPEKIPVTRVEWSLDTHRRIMRAMFARLLVYAFIAALGAVALVFFNASGLCRNFRASRVGSAAGKRASFSSSSGVCRSRRGCFRGVVRSSQG